MLTDEVEGCLRPTYLLEEAEGTDVRAPGPLAKSSWAWEPAVPRRGLVQCILTVDKKWFRKKKLLIFEWFAHLNSSRKT